MAEQVEDRFRRLMPRSQDLSVLVLKGHLLIEEQLNYFLKEAVRNPALLGKARLTYAQKLQLVEALSGSLGEKLAFATELNAIRNALAHRADVPDLPERVDALLHKFNKEVPKKLTPRQRAAWFCSQIAFVCGALRGFANGFHALVRLQANAPRQRTGR
jgi:hypothetical protein